MGGPSGVGCPTGSWTGWILTPRVELQPGLAESLDAFGDGEDPKDVLRYACEVAVEGCDMTRVECDCRRGVHGVVGQDRVVHHEPQRQVSDEPDRDLEQRERGGRQPPAAQDVFDKAPRVQSLAASDTDCGMSELDLQQFTDTDLDLLVGESFKEPGAGTVVLLGLDKRLDHQAGVESDPSRQRG